MRLLPIWRLFMPGNGDNDADRMNPNNDACWEPRGYDERPGNWEDEADDCDGGNGDDCDSRANQLNPGDDAYTSSWGEQLSPWCRSASLRVGWLGW